MAYNLKFEWFVNGVKDKPSTITAFAAFIIFGGLLLEMFIPEYTPFMKSGALLVCLAIFSVYVNHFVVKEASINKFIMSLLDNGTGTGSSLPPELGAEKIAEFDDRISQAKRLQHQMSSQRVSELNTVKDGIVKIEFLTGVVGTLISGFGDIFIQLLSSLIKFF